MSLQKKTALTISRELAAKISKRLPSTLILTEGFDASGNPTMTINDGTAATTEQNFFIRTIEQPVPTNAVDSLGLTQQSYGPHVIQIAMETSTVALLGFPTDANRLAVFGEVLRVGAKVEVYLSANGVVPVVASITGTPAATFESLYWGILGNS